MITRDIIRQAQDGTLRVPVDVQVDPHFGVRVGDRVAYCSVSYRPSLPFIAHMSRLDGWRKWLKLAMTGTVAGLVTDLTESNDGPMTHEQFWATTAEVDWDNGLADRYIKVALLAVEDTEHPIDEAAGRTSTPRWQTP